MSAEAISFFLPEELNASMPPERRGLRRDYVKMMVIDRVNGHTSHTQFYQLDHFLKAGDVLVLNASRTIPAVLQGQLEDGTVVEVRLAHRKSEGIWEALILSNTVKAGDKIMFSPLLTASILTTETANPFAVLEFNLCCSALYDQIYQIGQPVRYEYIKTPWELDYYQTVFATSPGSVEMPSAGRAFSWELLFRLQKKGVKIAYIQLHTGLSYLMDDKWHVEPRENMEEYMVPEETAQAVQKAKESGNKVIAVGTTVVRALESGADHEGRIRAASGWTNLYITAETKLQVADGLITGLHEPEASHLDLLSAFVSPELLKVSYEEAITQKYFWHEFGDMNLIL
ncbi:S-adenosylmethionine:tRNA ribosyltransferase-isomerase [Fictibacillus sp. WQ 8-8]|uniref:S-adenosylmethionine:tRNA ribosyltransferase-isomerase n=1 Tax=Fictibacillus sp. WQ 8-8 TaxID=2938788 RepID=UPI00210B8F19|nr:S-adenosylmethionine:tRNA ribosyltransferase-isomerase [Fictibacillus sp. WQ 8-8]MCQ6268318.1 S-adenosylmethionine:tRNA ribosyltransferase-isomerase [Fictibacillus sp. WQ 8-8]